MLSVYLPFLSKYLYAELLSNGCSHIVGVYLFFAAIMYNVTYFSHCLVEHHCFAKLASVMSLEVLLCFVFIHSIL